MGAPPFFGADFLAKETHLICCISWMRCVLWLEFSMWICLCAAGERRGGGGDRRLRLFPLPPPRARRSEIPASTRGSSLKVSPTESRERVKGGGTSSRFIRPVSFVPFHSPRFILPCYCSFRSPPLIQPHLRRKKANSSVSTAGRTKQIRISPTQSIGRIAAFVPAAMSFSQPV